MIRSGMTLDMDNHSLVQRIMCLIKLFEEVKVKHTYGETNVCADALTKASVESRDDVFFREEYPSLISQFVFTDVLETLISRLGLL